MYTFLGHFFGVTSNFPEHKAELSDFPKHKAKLSTEGKKSLHFSPLHELCIRKRERGEGGRKFALLTHKKKNYFFFDDNDRSVRSAFFNSCLQL